MPQSPLSTKAVGRPLIRGYNSRMIHGAHVIIYSKDAEADRAFFRDVLKYDSVDAGLPAEAPLTAQDGAVAARLQRVPSVIGVP